MQISIKGWSGLNFGKGERKDKQIKGVWYQSMQYNLSLPEKIRDILPQLKSWKEIGNFCLFDEEIFPQKDDPPEGMEF